MRKKYIGECRWASRVMSTIMVRFPWTATMYRARNRVKSRAWVCGPPSNPSSTNSCKVITEKFLFPWGDMTLVLRP